MNLVDASRDLVERARMGDQNAMAIISLTGKNARRERNSPTVIRARVAAEALRRAMRKSDIGAEAPEPPAPLLRGVTMPDSFLPCFVRLWRCKDGLCAIIVALANSGPLTLEKLTELSKIAGDMPPARRALRYAHNLQRVRNPRVPISIFSREASWELGD